MLADESGDLSVRFIVQPVYYNVYANKKVHFAHGGIGVWNLFLRW